MGGAVSASGEPALLFRGVSKTYAYSHLGRTTFTRGVVDLNLELRHGEAFGLLGLNGSGKTTAFKLALGLLRPTTGELRVLGGSPKDRQAHAGIGYLPELPYFYPFLTPRETLRFYGRLSGLAPRALEDRISELLSELGLSEEGDRKMGGFSKGMVQRVGLAQAVLHDPKLLILDEPASGLDPLAIKQFRESLGRLSAAGKTLLVSSHSIFELELVCQRVGILKEGRLVRTLEAGDWAGQPGKLETLFVETVQAPS